MIATIETGSPKVVGLKLSGKLHDEDYRRFVPMIESILTAEGKVRLFVQFEEFQGWDMHAAWDDFKFGLRHYSDFERIVMVGDRRWEKWLASVCKPFTKAKVKYFDKSEVDAAWKWLRENDEGDKADGKKDRPQNFPNKFKSMALRLVWALMAGWRFRRVIDVGGRIGGARPHAAMSDRTFTVLGYPRPLGPHPGPCLRESWRFAAEPSLDVQFPDCEVL